jgi:hypothetical protein
MSVVAEIERKLARLRAREAEDGTPDLRTSTMTHVVWAPPQWLPQARRTLAGLAERHPARTIFLVPEPGRRAEIAAEVTVRDFQVDGLSREVLSEVIEIRLRGPAVRHPGSIVLPLLISDLPAYCRWRGEPAWESDALAEIVDVCDRLVVDSSEWPGVPAAYGRLAGLSGAVAVSDIAFSRTLPWRAASPSSGRGRVGRATRVAGPRADGAPRGWSLFRLERQVSLTRATRRRSRRCGWTASASRAPGEPSSPSDLLSAELDQLGRDPVYEAGRQATRGVDRCERGRRAGRPFDEMPIPPSAARRRSRR